MERWGNYFLPLKLGEQLFPLSNFLSFLDCRSTIAQYLVGSGFALILMLHLILIAGENGGTLDISDPLGELLQRISY